MHHRKLGSAFESLLEEVCIFHLGYFQGRIAVGEDGKRIHVGTFELAADAAKVVDMSAKLLDLKGYNFYTDEDYHRERELELQELFMKKNVTDKEQQDSLLEHYKRMFPTEYQLRAKLLNTEESNRARYNDHNEDNDNIAETIHKISRNRFIKDALPCFQEDPIFMKELYQSISNFVQRNGVSQEVEVRLSDPESLGTATSENIFDEISVNGVENMSVAYKAFDFHLCLNKLQEGVPVSMVNIQDEIEMTHQTSKFTMVLPVDQ